MNKRIMLSAGIAAVVAIITLGASAWAASVQVGSSGKTFASSAVQCATNPATGALSPVVEAGLFNPKNNAKGTVSLNGARVATVTASSPSAAVWLADGANVVVVEAGRKAIDSYAFAVAAGACTPDTSGNWFSADGTLEYGASGKSYATVTPGCAWNAATAQAQPYVHLFSNGNYVLNVSVNGVPLTQLGGTYTHTAVFLSAGQNVISVASGSVSTDYFIRDGGDGTCSLP